MILNNTVKIKLNGSNIPFLLKNGYTNILVKNEEIEVDIKYLSINSTIEIDVKCDNCLIEKKLKLVYYNHATQNGTQQYFCKNCKQLKTKETFLKKYGVDNVFKLDVVKNKIKETNLERYGVENFTQNEDVKNKTKQTNLERYGVSFLLQNIDIQFKIKETNLERYGVENPAQNENVKNKMKETNLERYGVEFPLQSKEIREKCYITMLEKYGIKYSFQYKEFYNKGIETMIERYGEAFFHIIPKYNPLTIQIFDELSERLNINIQHALNGGEKKFQKYWVDGYIKEYNICIEYDEHRHKFNQEYDIERQAYIENNFNCKFIRIEEDKWLSDNNEKEKIFYLLKEMTI
jgi:hypothetical protein